MLLQWMVMARITAEVTTEIPLRIRSFHRRFSSSENSRRWLGNPCVSIDFALGSHHQKSRGGDRDSPMCLSISYLVLILNTKSAGRTLQGAKVAAAGTAHYDALMMRRARH
jgi:hypothetical protein